MFQGRHPVSATHRSIVAAVALALAAPVFADSLTFIHEGVGSGTLGGVPFGPASFVITSVADTANRVNLGFGFFINHSSSSIAIAGVATVDMLTGTRTFVNNTAQIVGYSDATHSADLFNGPTDTAFAAWDMLAPVGPITGSGRLIQWTHNAVDTSGGILVFNDNFSVSARFTAIMPCPADLDGDGAISLSDLAILLAHFGTPDGATSADGDLDADADVDLSDLASLLANFGSNCP